jgi:hypothetical protein
MNGVETLSPERIAEIKAFKNTDFSDCPIMTEEELRKLRPRHPEYYKPQKLPRTSTIYLLRVTTMYA